MFTAPDPCVTEPQCGQNMESCCIWTPVCYGYLYEDIIGSVLCIFSIDIPVTAFIEYTYNIIRLQIMERILVDYNFVQLSQLSLYLLFMSSSSNFDVKTAEPFSYKGSLSWNYEPLKG